MSGAAAHALAPPDAPLRQPDAFERTAFIVDEIDEAAMKIVGQVVKLKAARADRNGAQMREAMAELQRLYSQSSQLAGVTSRALWGTT